MLILYCDIQKKITELELSESGGIIGYDESNFIVIDDIGISARHIRLSCSDNTLYIEDLQSLNGTYLNDELLTEKREIRPRDWVLIGLILLYFEQHEGGWTVTASRQDISNFIVEEIESPGDSEESDDVPTAVTVVASGDIKKAIQMGNVDFLQNKTDVRDIMPRLNNLSQDTLQELGKYRIIKKIGKGGMGVVFLAKHKVMNTYRALKVLPHSIRDENYDFFERFMREARIASEIRHPNIVGVMDAETDTVQEVSYIVMEFIDGGTLRRILKNQKLLPEVQALLIVKSIAKALTAVAEHKIIHRDIKPDNIMFTRHGDVKLADLGIAKNEEEDVNLTRNDIMIGTPAYLSQEQIETPKDVDIRSDIYSLGATLYEMLTGETPYAGKNTYDILQKMISESIVDPRKKNPAVSAVTARLVMKMLQKNPDKRYQTPQALLNALNEILPHYPADIEQSIVKSAVLGTDYPQGLKKKVASGLRATCGFLFFSCRQRISEIFSPSVRNKGQTDHYEIASGRSYSFQIDTELSKSEKIDFTISLRGGGTCKIASWDGSCKDLKAAKDGKIEIRNLAPGEYRIFAEAEEKA